MPSPIRRHHLDAVLSSLKGRPTQCSHFENKLGDPWDFFISKEHDSFDARIDCVAPQYIRWFTGHDNLFEPQTGDPQTPVTTPLLARWLGSFAKLQMAFAALGLTPRFSFANPDRSEGQLLITPESGDVDTDLLALLRAFSALERDDIIALALAGYTQSDGWSDVAEVQSSSKQTAVFWHEQSHEAFDQVGMLQGTMFLYWRGDHSYIEQALRAEGFSVKSPRSKDVAIEISSKRTAPVLSTFEDYQSKKISHPQAPAIAPSAPKQRCSTNGFLRIISELDTTSTSQTIHRPGFPIVELLFSEDPSFAWVSSGFGMKGHPEPKAGLLSTDTFEYTQSVDIQPFALCVGVTWLSDGRIISVWNDREETQSVLRVIEQSDKTNQGISLFTVPLSHIGKTCALGTDKQKTKLALPTQNGITIRQVTPGGSPFVPPKHPTVIKRNRANTPAQGPWAEVIKARDDNQDGYPMCAMSPDGDCVVRTADGSTTATMFDANTGQPLWESNPFSGYYGARGTRSIQFDSTGKQVFVVTRKSIHPEGNPQIYHEQNQVVVFDTRTGENNQHSLEEGLNGALCVREVQPGVYAAGLEHGKVRLVTDKGKVHDEIEVFSKGSVTALAAHPKGLLLAGNDRGQLTLLQYHKPTLFQTAIHRECNETKYSIGTSTCPLAFVSRKLFGYRPSVESIYNKQFHRVNTSRTMGPIVITHHVGLPSF